MGMRYRNGIRLGGGIRINLSTRGLGWSVGGKGLRYTKPAGGRRAYSTMSVPGTGISYRTGSARQPRHGQVRRQPGFAATGAAVPRHPWARWLLVAFALLLIAAIPVAGPALFWIAVAALIVRRLLTRRAAQVATTTSASTWSQPVAPVADAITATPPEVRGPALHQTGLADIEPDAAERRRRAEELSQQLDELG